MLIYKGLIEYTISYYKHNYTFVISRSGVQITSGALLCLQRVDMTNFEGIFISNFFVEEYKDGRRSIIDWKKLDKYYGY